MKTDTSCTCTALRRASRALSHFYDALLEPSGINVAQLALLRAVRRLDTPNISTLAEALQLDRTTLGRNLVVLQRDGLVVVTTGGDQRARTVALTELGAQALATAAPLWDAAQAQIAERIGGERLQLLRGLLDDIESLAH